MPPVERTFSLHVPSSTENLSLIRDFVKGIGIQAGMDEMDVAMLEMSVDEACSNVIEHAYNSDSTQEVAIRATVDDWSVQIEVVDTGKGFDPAEVEQTKLENLISAKRSGGLGMRIMKTFMDEVRYESIKGVKNELRMIKRLRKRS